MKGYLRRVVPSTKSVRDATDGMQAASSRLGHYQRRGMTAAVPGALKGIKAESDRAVRSAGRLRAKSLAVGAGYGAAGTSAAVVVSRKRVEKAFGFSLPKGRLVPKSVLGRKPAIRQSYVGTAASGKKFSVRGSVR